MAGRLARQDVVQLRMTPGRRGLAHRARGCLRPHGLLSSGLHADVAQLVEHHLAKVRVAGSNPVVRSIGTRCAYLWRDGYEIFCGACRSWRAGGCGPGEGGAVGAVDGEGGAVEGRGPVFLVHEVVVVGAEVDEVVMGGVAAVQPVGDVV